MRYVQHTIVLYAATVFYVSTVGVFGVGWDVETPLDAFVKRPDSTYSYHVIDTYDADPDFTVHVLNMTSQRWMDDSWSDHPIWWHYLSIFIPKAVEGRIHDAAIIHVTYGDYTDDPPTMSNDQWMVRVGEYCRNTKAVTALLKTVPFQPILFADSKIPKEEDFILGYTWKKFLEDPSDNPDPEMVVHLAMTKAAKKALDTIHEFTKNQDEAFDINKFMPTGFSKRGWTSWLLGCVDKRVFAMAPTVFELLNMQRNLEHHYQGLGGWSFAMFPYWLEDVSKYLYHPRFPLLASFIDPLSFNERLTMPKFIISGSGDEFFPPDTSHYYFNKLTGPKYFQLWEDDSHSLRKHLDQRDSSIQAFFLSVYRNESLPTLTWSLQQNEHVASIKLTAHPEPATVTAWWADTPASTCEPDTAGSGICRRDFRLKAFNSKDFGLVDSGIVWSQNGVTKLGQGEYVVAYDKAAFGFRGFFIQMTYPGPDGHVLTFSTEINIFPDIFPYTKCLTEAECKGRIV